MTFDLPKGYDAWRLSGPDDNHDEIERLSEADMQRGTNRQWIADEVAKADHSSGPWKYPPRGPSRTATWIANALLWIVCAALWMGAGALLAWWA